MTDTFHEGETQTERIDPPLWYTALIVDAFYAWQVGVDDYDSIRQQEHLVMNAERVARHTWPGVRAEIERRGEGGVL